MQGETALFQIILVQMKRTPLFSAAQIESEMKVLLLSAPNENSWSWLFH